MGNDVDSTESTDSDTNTETESSDEFRSKVEWVLGLLNVTMMANGVQSNHGATAMVYSAAAQLYDHVTIDQWLAICRAAFESKSLDQILDAATAPPNTEN